MSSEIPRVSPPAHQPPRPTERSFGLNVGGVCVVAGAFSWWRGHHLVGPTLLGLGALLVTAALVAPVTLRLPNRIWWRFAQALGWFNSRVLLTAFFFLVLMPVGGIRRLFGFDAMRARGSDTNWSPCVPTRRGREHYRHLF